MGSAVPYNKTEPPCNKGVATQTSMAQAQIGSRLPAASQSRLVAARIPSANTPQLIDVRSIYPPNHKGGTE